MCIYEMYTVMFGLRCGRELDIVVGQVGKEWHLSDCILMDKWVGDCRFQ